jgi:putative spermidine/putrescine transport system substrate-binding protein
MAPHPTRRAVLAGTTLGLAAGGPGAAPAHAQARPFILRQLDLTETANGPFIFNGFAEANPGLLAGVSAERTHMEYLFGDIRAQVAAGRPPYHVVLTNLDGAAMGAELDLWEPMGARIQPLLPPMDELLTPLGRVLRGVLREHAQVIVASPGGPLLTYAPDRVPRMPRTAEGLLAWARENPGRFLYPRPEFSESGRCFVAGLPWMLQDRDPHDPEDGWPATWEYLAELDRHVAYYPTTTLAAMQELAEGGADIVATTLGVDILNRVTGLLPEGIGLAPLAGMHWIPTGLFVAVLRGHAPAELDTIAQAIAYLLSEPVQRTFFGRGQYWPGPVRQGIALENAPPEMRGELRRLVRSWAPSLIASQHVAPPLLLEETLTMLRRWDEDISAWHGVRP